MKMDLAQIYMGEGQVESSDEPDMAGVDEDVETFAYQMYEGRVKINTVAAGCNSVELPPPSDDTIARALKNSIVTKSSEYVTLPENRARKTSIGFNQKTLSHNSSQSKKNMPTQKSSKVAKQPVLIRGKLQQAKGAPTVSSLLAVNKEPYFAKSYQSMLTSQQMLNVAKKKPPVLSTTTAVMTTKAQPYRNRLQKASFTEQFNTSLTSYVTQSQQQSQVQQSNASAHQGMKQS